MFDDQTLKQSRAADARTLTEWGVDSIFGPGSSADAVIERIQSKVEQVEQVE